MIILSEHQQKALAREGLSHRDVVLADYVMLAAIGKGEIGYRCFMWRKDEPADEPLLMDAFTASAMVQVHDALGEENQRKFERMVDGSRVQFARLVDFTWKQVS